MKKTCENCTWCKECTLDGVKRAFCSKYDVVMVGDFTNKETDCDDFNEKCEVKKENE